MDGTSLIRPPVMGALALLSACAGDPAACNPRGAGFVAAASGVLGGCYEERVGQRREALSSTQQLTQQLEAEGMAIEGERWQTARQMSDTRARLDALARDTGSLRRQVASVRETTAEQARRKRDLEQQLAVIERDVGAARANQGSAPGRQREVERLTRMRNDLSDDLAAALRAD